jgi:electron transfer flavoprotein beta subunit
LRRILVGLKRVVDYSVRVHIRPDGSGVDTDGVKMSVNPFDEIALEEALRLREQGLADEIVVVSIGPASVEQQLRTGLAMGADRAIRIDTAEPLEPLVVARCLLALITDEEPLLVMLGKQAIDADNNQTGQLLAGLWQRPQATFASAITLDETRATVEREVDAGTDVIEIDLPAVITADLRLNEPRFVKLPQLLKAKKQTIACHSLEELGVEPSRQFEVLETLRPPERSPGTRVDSVDALVAELDRRGVL